MRRVNVHVDALIVHGDVNSAELRRALQAELSARFAAEPPEPARSTRIPSLRAELPPGSPTGGDALGRLAARAIHGGTKR